MEDAQTEIQVKEKEIKKLKMNQLMIETQANFQNLNQSSNTPGRSQTTYKKASNAEMKKSVSVELPNDPRRGTEVPTGDNFLQEHLQMNEHYSPDPK